jgi:hypothetical protein
MNILKTKNQYSPNSCIVGGGVSRPIQIFAKGGKLII